MKAKSWIKFGTVGALLATVSLFTGCTQIQKWARIKPAEVSPFIPKPELLVRQKETFPFHYFYLKKNAGTYENVYVAPVNTQYLKDNKNWARLDEKMAQQLGTDIKKIANFTKLTFEKEFANSKGPKTLHVVNAPGGKKTLVVEVAIVTIVPTKAELIILGTAGNLLLPGIGILANAVGVGSVTLECVIRDAATKEIVAMYSNTEQGQKAIVNIAGMTWYTSAENNIKKQAENTAKVFSGADYSSTWRRLVKIVEF